MKISEELYKALDEAEKRKLEKIKDKEAILAKENAEKDELSEKEIMEWIRRILLMRNMSRQERERQIKALMEQTGKKDEEISAMMEVEKLREQAQQKEEERDEPTAEVDVAKPFSYSENKEEAKGLYADQVDDSYNSPQQSEFKQIVQSGESEFERIKNQGKSEYRQIIEGDKDKSPSSGY